MTPMAELTGSPGFAPPRAGKTSLKRRALALELIATAALTVSLVVAATAVSLGNRSLARVELAERPSLSAPIMTPVDDVRSR